ncbi:MAG: translocation/assembly module TamB domain-containing protein [Polyangiaceae bacterium]
MKGFSLRSATGKLHIAPGQSIPIAVQGVPMGRAYGDISATARMSEDGSLLDVDVQIPKLLVSLPPSSGHSVQPIAPDPTIRVGHSSGGMFAVLPLRKPEEPRRESDIVIRAKVKLGNDVRIRRDATVDIVASGMVTAEVGETTQVGGQIRVRRGRLELQGRQFVIDSAQVSFVGGDPSDPLIVAKAYWDAPDGTRVFADFSGRVSSGALALRSEPSLTQDEILSLLLFGSPDGSIASQQSAQPPSAEGAGVKAVGLAGSYVTEGLNKALSGVTDVDISTRIDTSDVNNPRPELAVQLTRTVSARLSYKLGVPAPGATPDRTELSIDWRFVRNWSLIAVVGDQGSTSVDVVWRKRY